MSAEPRLELLAILSTMRNYGDKWTGAHDMAYAIGLRTIPDPDCRAVAAAVLVAFDERPSCKQILELHHRITNPCEYEDLAHVLSGLHELVQKYGEYGASHQKFPDNPRLRQIGPPSELDNMPEAVSIVIRAFGGWTQFAREFDFADGTDKSQFRKMYESVSDGASDAAVRQIALEHAASSPRELPEMAAHGARTGVLGESTGFETLADITAAVTAGGKK